VRSVWALALWIQVDELAPRNYNPEPDAEILTTALRAVTALRNGFLSKRVDVHMVLLEMSITPLGQGESVSQYVAECVRLIDESGLDYELHAMGTIVEGELAEVLDLMKRCIEQTARHSDRVTCAAKLDFRRGHSGRLTSKVASVEEKLGRQVRKKTS